jgi:hypothetical protein
MLPSPHEHTAAGGPTTPPAVLNPIVVTAVALTEGAALAAAMGAVESWNPLAYAKQDWRTCASGDGTTQGETWVLDSPEGVCGGQARFEYPATFVLFSNFRAAVLLAEAAIGRSLADGGS